MDNEFWISWQIVVQLSTCASIIKFNATNSTTTICNYIHNLNLDICLLIISYFFCNCTNGKVFRRFVSRHFPAILHSVLITLYYKRNKSSW